MAKIASVHSKTSPEPPRRAVPISFSIQFEKGVRLASQGKSDDAEACFLECAKLCPEAWLGVACTASQEGRQREAILRFEQVLAGATHPKTRAAAMNNLGSLLCNMALRDEALKYYEESWKLWRHQDSAANRAIVLRYQNRLDEAEKWIERAIRIKPDEHEFYFTRSLIRLTKGDYPRGFSDYESRWKNRLEVVKRIPIFRPEWNGEPLVGKTIMVYGEQGSGDTLHMARYLSRLKALGATVLVAPQPGLGVLLKTMGCVDAVYEDILQLAEKGNIPHWDFQVPTMSLPRILGERLETVSGAPYIPLPEPMALDSDAFKVGIVWAGSLDHKQDRWRSTHLEDWVELFTVDGAQFYSLQVGSRVLDLTLSDYPVIDLSPRLYDFTQTAKAIAALDLVISVDTSVVHLAGALGKPVWMLTPFSADWRWLTERIDSPWYDSLRLFRQRKELDWPELFGRVKEALMETVSNSRRHVTEYESVP